MCVHKLLQSSFEAVKCRRGIVDVVWCDQSVRRRLEEWERAGKDTTTARGALLAGAPSSQELDIIEAEALATPVTNDAKVVCDQRWTRWWGPRFVESGMRYLDGATGSPCKRV